MESAQPQSNELILWLKALELPLWVKVFLLLIMAAILTGAGTILAHGLYHGDKEEISAATTLLAISLPILLIVTALVFGTNAEKSLQKRSARVLVDLIPKCIRENLEEATPGQVFAPHEQLPASPRSTTVTIDTALRGCIADYHLCIRQKSKKVLGELKFSVALNLRKANVVFWLPLPEKKVMDVSHDATLLKLIGQHRHTCIIGALNEGYKLNPSPEVRLIGNQKMLGLVFIKLLPNDFVIQAQETLYFAQDLAFFVRGFIDMESPQDA